MTLRQSIFQAREMLLDYYENKLDSERHEFVKKVLATDVETERTLNQIKKGLDFTKGLSQVRIEEDFLNQLGQAESFFSLVIYYSNIKNWSQTLRTSVYATLSCVLIAAIVLSLPRSMLLKLRHPAKPETEIVLSQVPKGSDAAADAADPEKQDAQIAAAENLPTDTDEDEGDQGGGDEAGPPQKAAILKAKTAGNSESENQTEEKYQKDESDTKQPKGFVYRGTMKIDELEERTPLIAQEISDLGGRKAGEVELGWKKENRGSYYHFSMPEENYDKLLEYLHGFGPVRFSKDSHPRVMPAGQIRIILWVERNDNEGQ